jgi:plasmid maintenance system killer protein
LDIWFSSTKLQKECNNATLCVRRYGPRRAALIQRRLDELRAADILENIRHLPGPRCHELKGDRDGQLSVDLDHPYRLIFEPANDPVPQKPDGGLDWSQVTAISILEVTDTHG